MLVNVNVSGDFEEDQEKEYTEQVFEHGGDSINVEVKRTYMSEELAQKIKDWKKHNKLKAKANDHTRCPLCKEQLYFCYCAMEMSNEILLRMEEEKLI